MPNVEKVKQAHKLLWSLQRLRNDKLQRDDVIKELGLVWSDRTNRNNAFEYMNAVGIFTGTYDELHRIVYQVVDPSTFNYENAINGVIEWRTQSVQRREARQKEAKKE